MRFTFARLLVDDPVRSFHRLVPTFEVSNVDESVGLLRNRGADIVSEPTDQPDWGIRVAHVRDPDGNLVEVFETLAG